MSKLTKENIVNVIKALSGLIEEDPAPAVVLKAVDLEEQRITAVVLEPCGPENPDKHLDWYTYEDVQKACENFNEFCMQPNVQHMANVGDDAAVIEQSWIQPVDCYIGEQVVKSGSWLQTWKINSDDLWESVKDGKFTGFSIGGRGHFEDTE